MMVVQRGTTKDEKDEDEDGDERQFPIVKGGRRQDMLV